MRIAVAQINATLGDITENKNKILDFTLRAKKMKAQLVVFPESCLLGYHPFDLLERTELVSDLEKAVQEIQKKLPADIAILIGTITKNPKKTGRPYFNSAVLLQKSKKPQFFHKQLLPTGDVFDEARFIEVGDLSKNYFNLFGKKFFLTICEDIWAWPNQAGQSAYSKNPLIKIQKKKIDLVINLSASPWHIDKEKLRNHVTKKTAQNFKAPLLYVNLVGAQDEIIFDGESFLMSPKGKRLFQCHKFQEDLNVFDTETQKTWAPSVTDKPIEQLRKALVLGIKDFLSKTGLEKVHLGLSGGIDSAVVACLAVDALGPAAVKTLALPGPYSESISLELAQKLAKNLNVECKSVSINKAYQLCEETFKSSLGATDFGVAFENLQSRLRGIFLMGYSNLSNSLLLTTGNKSEYATGYCTLYGDMCGGLAPIADLTKEQVYELAKHYNSETELIPAKIIDRAPSAELKPNQKDQDSLPPYEELDRAVVNIVQHSKKPKTKTEKWLLEKLVQTEFKRWQSAPILKVTSHSFGRGRRWPLAHKTFKKN
jgi:NAD+ synthase (glutamine-hydrolysing)